MKLDIPNRRMVSGVRPIIIVAYCLLFMTPAVVAQWPKERVELIKNHLESGHAGPAIGGFVYTALLVTPEINDAFNLGYDLERHAIVRVGFQAALAREVPTFEDLDSTALLKGEGFEIAAVELRRPAVMLPGKPKGRFVAAKVGPNDSELVFPVEPTFWDQRDVEFRYHVKGMALKEKLRLR